MVLIPKVTTEDLRLALNGTYSGSSSSYFFWGQEISSGSMLAQINLSNYYLYGVLGLTKMDDTTDRTYYHVRTCELDYSCMRVLIVLSGGVLVDGFSWSAGVSVQQPHMLNTYRNLIEQFKASAQLHLRSIQDIAVSEEADQPNYGSTATSIM